MNISFIGGGVMAEAIINGILSQKMARKDEIYVGEPVDEPGTYIATMTVTDPASSFMGMTTPEQKHIFSFEFQLLPDAGEDVAANVVDPGTNVVDPGTGEGDAGAVLVVDPEEGEAGAGGERSGAGAGVGGVV